MRGALLVVLLFADPAHAEQAAESAATCNPREAEELRAHLTRASRRASQWNLAWRVTLTSASVGSLAVGLWNPLPELRDGMFVSGGKAAFGAFSRWMLPLKIDVPAPDADRCAEVAALRKAVAKASKRERALFYTGHVGGITVNLGGAAILWYRGSPGQALLSMAIGYPVGLLVTYTMPRGSWQLFREHNWTIAALPQRDGFVVLLGGEI